MAEGGRGCWLIWERRGGKRRLVPGASALRRLSPGRRRQDQLGTRNNVCPRLPFRRFLCSGIWVSESVQVGLVISQVLKSEGGVNHSLAGKGGFSFNLKRCFFCGGKYVSPFMSVNTHRVNHVLNNSSGMNVEQFLCVS